MCGMLAAKPWINPGVTVFAGGVRLCTSSAGGSRPRRHTRSQAGCRRQPARCGRQHPGCRALPRGGGNSGQWRHCRRQAAEAGDTSPGAMRCCTDGSHDCRARQPAPWRASRTLQQRDRHGSAGATRLHLTHTVAADTECWVQCHCVTGILPLSWEALHNGQVLA